MEDANTHYPRVLKATLLDDLKLYPAVAVMGARQVGKSTLCLELAKELGFANRTLDDSDVRERALSDPEGLLAELGDSGAFIDEVQRAPDLLLALKAVIDREQRPGRYLLSGSNQPRMGGAVGDSLLGRAAYRTLRPLTLSELRFDEYHRGWSFLFNVDDDAVLEELGRRAISSGELDWREIVRTGGFPRALAAPADQRIRLLEDYVEVFSGRDIRDLITLESGSRFDDFVRLIGARSAQELNASGIASDLGIPVSTIRRWLDALRRSYLVEVVPAYSRNPGSRLIKAPKLFVVDTAFALAAAGEELPTGFHLETLVASDMFVWRDSGPSRRVYHWRKTTGPEVDLVIEEHGQLVGVEVKSTSSIGISDARHLRTLREMYPQTVRGLVLSCDREIRLVGSNVVACPWWAVL